MKYTSKHERQAIASILPVIGSVIDTLRVNNFTILEQERFQEDLITLKKRLVCREYLQSSFKPRNQLSIPERTGEFFQELSFFFSIGKIWQALFSELEEVPFKKVLDIGPGYFPKVELGLYYSGYSGAVTLLDQDPRATESAEKFLNFFKCSFLARTIHKSILDEHSDKYDLIVANHFLDDYALACHCKDRGIDIGEAYQSEKLYRAVWNDIERNLEGVLSGVRDLAIRFIQLLLPGGSVLLLDYTSFSHRALELEVIPRCVKKIKKTLLAELERNGMTPRKLLSKSIKSDRLRISNKDLTSATKNARRAYK
jgi:Methyltransferase small domain